MTLDKFNDNLFVLSDFFDAGTFNLFIDRDNVIISLYVDERAICNIKLDKDFYVKTYHHIQELACEISNPRITYKDNNLTKAEESAIMAILKMFK